MQQFYKQFSKQCSFYNSNQIVFSEIKDLSKVGLILLHACVYKYVIVHWQTNELNNGSAPAFSDHQGVVSIDLILFKKLLSRLYENVKRFWFLFVISSFTKKMYNRERTYHFCAGEPFQTIQQFIITKHTQTIKEYPLLIR